MEEILFWTRNSPSQMMESLYNETQVLIRIPSDNEMFGFRYHVGMLLSFADGWKIIVFSGDGRLSYSTDEVDWAFLG